ncbi:APC family permease [Streptomyces sp. NPDC053741]|uniref:Amino acid permease-associated region n=2 Tax=Streptomyces TaxID=1883 RepID=A0A8D4BBC4_STRFA|nr:MULTISPECIES: APC family permease [Streptomyces]MBD2833650.1 APC family permease [Streptomyces pratensis]RAS31461.1 amino acid/polyamine/organocation transporter (APC superfamily) [Streptomyces avidinii]TPM87991.1 APC family permease [Mesorhizobium sp. B2-3-3]SNX77505.1 amino acid/polyamine/organocation transporter, APC superfamily [Streptomyces microflavus]MCY1653434.1 APC family permease [Streptomyces sp. SL203]
MAVSGGSTAEGKLRRTLGFRDLVVYGLLFIAPMAPVGVFGTLDAKSDGAVALVYLVATVVMAFTAFSYAQMVHVAPLAGSVFAYARKGLGEGPGFIAGWMAMLDYLLIPAVAYLFSGIAMNALVPEVSRWVWTAIAVVVTTALNLWGVRAAARVGFAVLAMEIVVLLVFVVSAVVVLARDGAERGWLTPLTGDTGFSTTAVLGAVSVAVLSYLGFDAIASFAEEVTGGSAKVARAVLFCLVLAGALFVVQSYLAALLEPVSSAELAADPVKQGSAFYDAVDASVGTWLHDLVAVSKAIGAAFAALAGQAAAGRLVFAMGREGRLPSFLSRVDGGSGVPRVAIACAAVVTLVAAVWAARRDDGLDHLVSVVNVGALTAFVLLHASVVGWFAVRRMEGPPSWWRHVVVPVVGAGVLVAVILEATATAQLVGVCWLGIGLVVLALQWGRRTA